MESSDGAFLYKLLKICAGILMSAVTFLVAGWCIYTVLHMFGA